MKYARQDDEKSAEQASLATATINTEPSKTLQGHAQEADINNIAKAFGLSGRNMPVPPEAMDPRYYGDLSDIPDLQTALDRVLDAQHHFDNLPAELRSKFHHSPGVLWDYIQDPRNHAEAVQLGLLKQIAPESTSSETGEKPKQAPDGA